MVVNTYKRSTDLLCLLFLQEVQKPPHHQCIHSLVQIYHLSEENSHMILTVNLNNIEKQKHRISRFDFFFLIDNILFITAINQIICSLYIKFCWSCFVKPTFSFPQTCSFKYEYVFVASITDLTMDLIHQLQLLKFYDLTLNTSYGQRQLNHGYEQD